MNEEEIKILEDDEEIEYVKMEDDTTSKSKGGGFPILPIVAVLLVVVALVLGGFVIYKTINNRALTDISDIRPVSAEYLIGQYVIRVYPTKEGNHSFMNKPIKIIHAKEDMINYIDENGDSNILDSSFCDEYWMSYESYKKVKELENDKYDKWIEEIELEEGK